MPRKAPLLKKAPLLTIDSRIVSSRVPVRHGTKQRGASVTLTVTVLMVIALLLLTGPFELARVTWLLSQSA